MSNYILTDHAPGKIDIVIPNRSDVEILGNPNADLDINWVYTPQDDLQDRNHYKAWLHDPQDKSNRDWFCKSVFNEFPEDYYHDYWDRALGETQYTPHGSHHSYCLGSY